MITDERSYSRSRVLATAQTEEQVWDCLAALEPVLADTAMSWREPTGWSPSVEVTDAGGWYARPTVREARYEASRSRFNVQQIAMTQQVPARHWPLGRMRPGASIGVSASRSVDSFDLTLSAAGPNEASVVGSVEVLSEWVLSPR